MVVIDRDYLTIPADQIKDIKPVMTIVGGRVVFDAAKDKKIPRQALSPPQLFPSVGLIWIYTSNVRRSGLQIC